MSLQQLILSENRIQDKLIEAIDASIERKERAESLLETTEDEADDTDVTSSARSTDTVYIHDNSPNINFNLNSSLQQNEVNVPRQEQSNVESTLAKQTTTMQRESSVVDADDTIVTPKESLAHSKLYHDLHLRANELTEFNRQVITRQFVRAPSTARSVSSTVIV